jgi:hypothetical protein
MKRFLTRFGWPGISDEAIMQLLPDMFRYLDSLGLIPKGFTYQKFYQAAYQRYQIREFSKDMKKKFG